VLNEKTGVPAAQLLQEEHLLQKKKLEKQKAIEAYQLYLSKFQPLPSPKKKSQPFKEEDPKPAKQVLTSFDGLIKVQAWIRGFVQRKKYSQQKKTL
jgi:hypothetical protein